MLKKRLIPILFLKNGLIVRSQEFNDFRELGNPVEQLRRLNDWEADELVYVDITRSGQYDLKRDDLKFRLDKTVLEILKTIGRNSFMPLTFGGRIFSFDTAAAVIEGGADKVVINTGAHRDPKLIPSVARQYGSQCVVFGIDVKAEGSGPEARHAAFTNQGTEKVDIDPVELARKAVEWGAGEIFLNSIDRDGTASGFDLEIIRRISSAVSIPVVACGGAGATRHFQQVLMETNASAVAAGNIFNFTENAYSRIKKELIQKGCGLRGSSKGISSLANLRLQGEANAVAH
jgi:imidazole glycerol-phosphate synthase subunit HisF